MELLKQDVERVTDELKTKAGPNPKLWHPEAKQDLDRVMSFDVTKRS